jgi:antitoxin MazE
MRTKVVKWGNSLGLRIPKAIAEEVPVKEGSAVELLLEDGGLVIRLVESKPAVLEQLLAGVTTDNLHGEFDTGGAVGGEIW